MNNKNITMPLIAIKDMVILKGESSTLDISKRKSINALEVALEDDKQLFLVLEKEDKKFNNIGTIVKIKKHNDIMPSITRVVVEGVEIAKIEEITQNTPFFKVNLSVLENEYDLTDEEEMAFLEILKDMFAGYARVKNNFMPDIIMDILSTDNINDLFKTLLNNINLDIEDKLYILNEISLKNQLEYFLKSLSKKIKISEIEADILSKTKVKIDKTQKEYYLREQLKTIKKELDNEENSDADEYRNLLNKKTIPSYAKEKLEKEINRLDKISTSSPEYMVCNEYINFVINLPWQQSSDINKDILNIEEQLEKGHFGLEDVKERITEHIAVMQTSKSINITPILCLLGPPGVGKTSIAKSIANALNIKYTRISLGGLRDEAEIRGHRKTYIGAMAGRIIKAINDTKTDNPLILLDEIDKISTDFRGDPSAALLEVLDKEQNKDFKDSYLEIPFDISKVFFICTANDISKIPAPLRDRLEIIQLSSYTTEEKETIASKFLIPKQLQCHNLSTSNLKISKSIIKKIITEYTRETGVRQLERNIAKLCRKTVKLRLEGNYKNITITNNNIKNFLGAPKYKKETLHKKDIVGCVRGLAWTSVGGTTLDIEVAIMEGNGKVSITGNIGKVMNESAQAAISYIRANYKKYNLPKNFYKINDIHIHIPEGATPKDGPSAGITITVAIISALTNKKVNKNVAMTGEITLRGNVLPIGGLKEKILAAKRIGIKTVIIPKDNEVDMEEMPDYIKSDIEIILASNIETVLQYAILN
ncbi:endopeptidase La [uncultured Tyzzerella sp.]|uniref:endopeptidase La n=1 Tax=uncultured Tyzzerella sp. TaxID=2321398 RepID=UPI0029423E53|nr:endopeptidase La [uncultured Tyzzerella sp.]